jgi:phenylacetate-coenzyme A ligase PaaK-like adenylate-forming protein
MNMQMMLNVLSNLGDLRRHDHWNRAQLEAYQAKALHRLRVHSYAESPFYQKFHKGITDSPLSKLPVLTKSMVMEHFDHLVTDRAIHLNDVKDYVGSFREGERYLDRYWVNATSGSTGQPGFFLFDNA